MPIEQTLCIIKPDAVAKGFSGEIDARIEKAGLKIIAAKMLQLTQQQAEHFYAIHKERPFFKDLVRFMISRPVLVHVLVGEDAVARYRELMGATDPRNAAPGTLRADFAESIDENAVHGSDSIDNAANEVAFFFSRCEICG